MTAHEETRNRPIHLSAWLSLTASLFFFVGLFTSHALPAEPHARERCRK